MSDTPTNINELQKKFEEVSAAAPTEHVEKVIFSYEELFELKDVEVPFIIADLIPAHSCSVLFGEDGIGKTMLTIQLCMHIALKYKTFLNLPLNAQHGRAMLVATETAKTKFIRAAAKQQLNLNNAIKPKDVGFDFLEGYGVDNLEELIKELKKKLDSQPYDLIAIDVLGDLFVMAEFDMNNSTHARNIIQKLQKLCEDYKTTVILIHHAAKTKLVEKRKTGKIFVDKDDQIGAGAITGKPRAVLALSNNPKSSISYGNYHTYDNFLHVVKMNEGGRTYVQNALRCSFDTSTLLHTYKELTEIATFEVQGGASDVITEPFTVNNDYTYEVHRQNILTAYGQDSKMSAGTLANRIKAIYKVGMNKAGDIRNHALSLGLIYKDGLGYTLKIIPDEIDQAKQQEMNLPPMPDGAEEETPF